MAKDDLIKLRVGKDLKEAAAARAKAEGVSLSEALRRLLAEWVQDEKGGKG